MWFSAETLSALLVTTDSSHTLCWKVVTFPKKEKHSWQYWQPAIFNVPAPSQSLELTVASVTPHVSGASHPFFFVCSRASCMSVLIMLWVSLLPPTQENHKFSTQTPSTDAFKKEVRQSCCEKQCSFRLRAVILWRGLSTPTFPSTSADSHRIQPLNRVEEKNRSPLWVASEGYLPLCLYSGVIFTGEKM